MSKTNEDFVTIGLLLSCDLFIQIRGRIKNVNPSFSLADEDVGKKPIRRRYRIDANASRITFANHLVFEVAKKGTSK